MLCIHRQTCGLSICHSFCCHAACQLPIHRIKPVLQPCSFVQTTTCLPGSAAGSILAQRPPGCILHSSPCFEVLLVSPCSPAVGRMSPTQTTLAATCGGILDEVREAATRRLIGSGRGFASHPSNPMSAVLAKKLRKLASRFERVASSSAEGRRVLKLAYSFEEAAKKRLKLSPEDTHHLRE